MSEGNTSLPTIAWIGAGVMGRSMAGHLMAAGHPVRVFTRTQQTAAKLVENGATWAASPKEASNGADIAITMVGFPEDVEEVILGSAGVLAAEHPAPILIDMTTSQPSLAVRIADAARAKGTSALDAPVSGGDVGAQNATLSIMVGGDEEAFAKAKPVFDRLGQRVVLQGGAGAGQHTKMVNQILIASGMVGVCEALVYARKAGLDAETVLESVSAGAAGSWSLSNLAPRMLKRDFAPGFYVEHFLKDLRIALDECAKMNLAVPGLAMAHQLYVALRAQGHGRSGTQALLVALENLSGVRPDGSNDD